MSGMPASTLEPVSAALRIALSQNSSENFLSSQLSGSARRVLNTSIEVEPTKNFQNTVLNSLKSKYIVLQPNKAVIKNNNKPEMGTEDTLDAPQKILYPLEAVQLGWNNADWSVGSGLVNMGNTCYLNSILQALFHVPSLVNWLLSDKQHMVQCDDSGSGSGGCIICAMSKTLQASQQRTANAIRPWLVYSKLRNVCKHLAPGRQEDAHEFLRYLVEAMERAYLQRFRNISPLDSRSKETTPLNQILGGYLRSAVRCLECGHVSTTFQHFQDLLVDIRKVNTLDDALDLYFSREKLDDLAYHCENCQKKVLATKQFSLERAPMVLCIQLKRFSISNNKITKHITFRQRLELTRFARRKPTVPLIYRLVSMVTHVGQTVGCGHYTAVAQAPSGNYYQFDDSMVRSISQQSVFSTNAYIMLYELEHSSSSPISSIPNKNFNNNNNSKIIQKTDDNVHTTKEPANIPLNNLPSPYLNGLSLTKNSTPVTTHTPTFSQNGNGNGRCSNGNQNNTDSGSTSDSDDSETVNGQNTPTKTNSISASNNISPKNSPKSNTNSPNSSLSSYNSTLNSPKSSFKDDTNTAPISKERSPQLQSILKKNKISTYDKEDSSEIKHTKHENNVNSSQPVTKLVPYEVDDSSSSVEDLPMTSTTTETVRSEIRSEVRSQVVTKAQCGNWQISTTNTFYGPSHEGQTGWNRRQRETVTELIHMSHEGYSAPVNTWNGTRAALDREISNERRKDRKRTLNDNNPDKNKIKQPKHNSNNNNNNNSYNMNNKSNPGYNPFQEYNNNRKWLNDSHYYKKSHYNRYQRRGGYHNNRHRDKFRH